MERLVEVMLSKVNILSILNCYYRLFQLICIGYDSEGITIQGSCEEQKFLATTVIPRESFEHYECKESMVTAVPIDLKKLGGRCVRINVLRVDSWRVRNVFESDNGVSMKLLVAICINYQITLRWSLLSHLSDTQLQRSV